MTGAVGLAEMLQTNKVLEHLSLNNCDISDDGVQAIAQGIIIISRLVRLNSLASVPTLTTNLIVQRRYPSYP